MKRRPRNLIVAMAAFALVAASCGGDDGSSEATTAETTEVTTAETTEETTAETTDEGTGNSVEGLTVGFVLSGAVNDGGYYEEQYNGLNNLAQEYGFETAFVENAVDPADQITGMRNLANEGVSIILVDGSMGASSAEVAPEFPDVTFVVMTAPTAIDLPNMFAYVVQQGVPSYVLGALAANLSKSGKVGYIGGIEIPPTTETRSGFFEGATATNEAIETAEAIVGDFSDVVGAKDAAAAQIANGVDVIYGFVDAGLLGVDQASEEAGGETLIFSATVSRCDVSDRVVGSAMANSEATIRAVIDDYIAGAMEPGTKFFGLEDPNIQWVLLCPAFDTPENQQIVEEAVAAILSGEVQLSGSTTGT